MIYMKVEIIAFLASFEHWKTSFERLFFLHGRKLNMGLINKDCYGMFFSGGIWCVADVSSVSLSSEQTEFLTLICPMMRVY